MSQGGAKILGLSGSAALSHFTGILFFRPDFSFSPACTLPSNLLFHARRFYDERMATNTGTPKEVDLRKCAGVGQGIQRDVADDIRKEIEGMPTLPFYQQKESAQYPFEALDSSTIQGAVKPVVDAWLNVCAYCC